MFLAENQRNGFRDALPYSKTKCVSWCLETKGPDVSIPPEKKVASQTEKKEVSLHSFMEQRIYVISLDQKWSMKKEELA